MAYKFNPFTGTLDEVGTGGGGTTPPAGSDTQIQFNDGGAFGGDAGLTYNKTTDELTVAGDINLDDGGAFSTTVQSVTPTANRTISFPDATGTVALVSGADGTIQYNDAGTLKGNSDFTVDLDWNDASTAFTGLKLNVTDGAGGSPAGNSDSKLLDLQVGGTSQFRLNNEGAITSPNDLIFTRGATTSFRSGSTRFSITSELGLSNNNASSPDIFIARDAANTLAQRNGTAAQTYRLYNTWGNNGVDFERTSLTRDSSGLVIDAQKGGTGVDPTNLLDVKLDGTSKYTFSSSTASGVNFSSAFKAGLSIRFFNIDQQGNAKFEYLDNSYAKALVLYNPNSSSIGYGTKLGFQCGSGISSSYIGAAVESTDAANQKLVFEAPSAGSLATVLEIGSLGYLHLTKGSTIASLPGTPAVGMIARVTDGDSGLTFGNTVVNTGAGATPYLCWYNGTNWTVIGA